MTAQRAKKSLGQHFLMSKPAIEATIDAAELSVGDTVLEVGPGRGALTEMLLARGMHVVAVEKDEALAHELTEKFHDAVQSGHLSITEGDILEIDRRALGFSKHSYSVVANIPYYLTGRILRLLLSDEPQPKTAAFIMQKEVAERVTANTRAESEQKESILSISVKAYGDPRYVRTIKAGSFSPPPEVDSAIVSITNISKERFVGVDESFFFSLVKAGFGQKRKQLRGNLREVALPEQLSEAFATAGIPENTRAEDLSVTDWTALSQALQ